MEKTAPGTNGAVSDALRTLLKAGLELGVAEAVRRLAQLAPAGSDRSRQAGAGAILSAAALTEFVQAVKDDSGSVFQLVKEVWSRGGTKERKTAAHALGHALARFAPHRALGLSRELAAMARSSKEADVVGEEAIGPILEANPPLFDRVKLFLADNERWVRRAAIAGLVAYVTRRRKMAGLALEVILLVGESNEKEIKSAVRWAVREVSKVDWKETSQALVEWARIDPTRLKAAKQYASAASESVKRDVQKLVLTRLAKFAEGAPPVPPAR